MIPSILCYIMPPSVNLLEPTTPPILKPGPTAPQFSNHQLLATFLPQWLYINIHNNTGLTYNLLGPFILKGLFWRS